MMDKKSELASEDEVTGLSVTARCSRCWRSGIPPTWLVVCAALTTQVGFGLYPVIVKEFAVEGDRKANPYIFSFYRDLGCCPLLFVCAVVAERKIMIPGWRMIILFMVLGLFGMFGGQLLYITGVYSVGADAASAIQPLIPVWTAILAVVTCTEKLSSPALLHTWTKILGILFAVVGAVEVVLTGHDSDQDSHSRGHGVGKNLLGYVSLFGNTLCTAIYVLLQKKFIFNKVENKWKEYPVAITAYSYFFGASFMGISSLYFPATGQSDVYSIPAISSYALVYAIFVASALCYLLITWTNLHLSATVVTAFYPLQVAVSVIAAYFITSEELTHWQYLGVLTIMGGLLLVLFSNYMDERQGAGKSVVRLDCCCPQPIDHLLEAYVNINTHGEDTEEAPLLAGYCSTAGTT